MRDHRKLRAFELADSLAVAVYRATRSFPSEEVFGLTSQLRRAVVSSASNIVEGCARSSSTEYVRFLYIAYGSSMETQYQLSLAHRLGYISDEEHDVIASLAVETSKVLNGLIRALKGRA